MAKAVEFRHFIPENSRDDLTRRIEEAPVEHAEAFLAALSLLQKLHDAGLLSLANGLIGGGGAIIKGLAEAADSPQAIAGIRTALILGSILNNLNADDLEKAMHVTDKDASILNILKGVCTKESRRAAMVGVNLLNVFGKALVKDNRT